MVKEARVSEKEVPSAIAKFFVITSKVSPSQPSGDWPVVVESSVSPA